MARGALTDPCTGAIRAEDRGQPLDTLARVEKCRTGASDVPQIRDCLTPLALRQSRLVSVREQRLYIPAPSLIQFSIIVTLADESAVPPLGICIPQLPGMFLPDTF
jgi:hypothetical protein